MLDERIYESYIGILKEEMVMTDAARASSNPFTVSIV